MMKDAQSGKRFASLFLCTIALLAAMASAPFGAWGATTLDQEYVPTAPASKKLTSSYYGGQTFTVGIDGVLDSFEVELYPASATTDIDWRIETTSGGLPAGTVLASGTIANASVVGGFVAVDVSAAAIPVAIGEMYVIILQGRDAWPTTAATWGAGTGSDATYTGGNALDMSPGLGWKATANDYGFRTYVPEPGQEALELSALFVLSFLALFTLPVRRNRRNQRS